MSYLPFDQLRLAGTTSIQNPESTLLFLLMRELCKINSLTSNATILERWQQCGHRIRLYDEELVAKARVRSLSLPEIEKTVHAKHFAATARTELQVKMWTRWLMSLLPIYFTAVSEGMQSITGFAPDLSIEWDLDKSKLDSTAYAPGKYLFYIELVVKLKQVSRDVCSILLTANLALNADERITGCQIIDCKVYEPRPIFFDRVFGERELLPLVDIPASSVRKVLMPNEDEMRAAVVHFFGYRIYR